MTETYTVLMAVLPALVVAFFTGTLRQGGRHLQHLLELVDKMPPGAAKCSLNEKAEVEAQRLG